MAGPCFRTEVYKVEVGESIFIGFISATILGAIMESLGIADFSIIVVFAFMLLIGSLFILLQTYDEELSAMNPHDILNCINKGKGKWEEYSNLPEIEKLEKAYSLASRRAYEAFKASLIGWIITGVGNAVLGYAIMEGALQYDSPITKLAVVGGPLLGFTLFVLMIFTYLKHKEYDKQLFAIQLKKSDKAEISIKI
ncbi:hypothetical protein [Thermococcus sp.]|uniref:hypothetical protein n=1 Tax=Thermococcus sp. TaxID=35749 RepID=UPI002601AF45|nr:hypothetical protein [Thermococcus sp.]